MSALTYLHFFKPRPGHNNHLDLALRASMPIASWLEYMDWNDDLWIEPILPSKDGTMSPPERPGHGLAFRPEVLKEFRVGGTRMKG